MIFRLEISRRAEKQLRKLPRHIVDSLLIWSPLSNTMASKRCASCPATTMSR